MRHFLAPTLTPGPLPGRVPARPAQGPLVAISRPPQTLPTLCTSAPIPAVHVSPIAAAADPDLHPAARAVVKPGALPDPHRDPVRRGTGRRARLAA